MKTKMIDLRETIMMKHQVEVITNRKKRRRREEEKTKIPITYLKSIYKKRERESIFNLNFKPNICFLFFRHLLLYYITLREREKY